MYSVQTLLVLYNSLVLFFVFSEAAATGDWTLT